MTTLGDRVSISRHGRVVTSFPVLMARSFGRRLRGLFFRRDSVCAVWLLPCRSVHTFFLKSKIQVIFLDAKAQVIESYDHVPSGCLLRDLRAHSVLELKNFSVLVRSGDQVCHRRGLRRPSGFSVVEAILALPVLLFAALLVLQVGLLWQAKLSVGYAANLAARQASLEHGHRSAIRDGLVQGLLPLVGRSQGLSDLPKALWSSGAELTAGLLAGWIRWEVLSPTLQSFQDWGEPGDPLLTAGARAEDLEIPSAPLPALALRRRPKSGVVGDIEGLPIGRVSGQTLLDANTLKLHLSVGVPLNVPLAGKLMARLLSAWHACGLVSGQDRMGVLRLGQGSVPVLSLGKPECSALAARGIKGNWTPRWPVEASAVVRMQSNARRSVMDLRPRQQDPELTTAR